MAVLRSLAQHCNYKESLQDMLRDMLVCGVNHKGIQQRLLAEKTYDKALQLALSIESAEKGTQDLSSTAAPPPPPPTPSGIHFTSNRGRKPQGDTPTGSKPTCYRCGGGHLAPQCKFNEAECHHCKKKGHLARVCK